MRGVLILFLCLCSIPAIAKTKRHKGFYALGSFGLTTARHDNNVRVTPVQNFGGSAAPAYGIDLGYNITPIWAPDLQIVVGSASGTTPGGPAREFLLTGRVNLKYSFLTKTISNRNNDWQMYPYAKLGAVAHGVLINTPDTDDKIAVFGSGGTFGGGVNVAKKIMYFGVDLATDLVFLPDENNLVNLTSTTVLNGGFIPIVSFLVSAGVHF